MNDLSQEELERFRFSWSDLPTISTNLPGTEGIIRTEVSDFQVTELPAYEPEGKGSHAYAKVEKQNLTTHDIVSFLVSLGLPEKSIGVAGLKDKRAIATQWISVPKKHEKAFQELDDFEGVKVLTTSLHKNRLGLGHLFGNSFNIHIRNSKEEALEKAKAILDCLQSKGVPNYFGPQRFGNFGSNAIDGYKLLKGEEVPGGYRLKRFFISALQSFIFNQLLKLRIERNLFDKLLLGDWAKKHDTGGIFIVTDLKEIPRAAALEISATLPLYGKKVRLSDSQAGSFEREVLETFGFRWIDFAKNPLSLRGSRRITRIIPWEVSLKPSEDGYWLAFNLPKGAFATSVLREVMKIDVDAPQIVSGSV